MAGASANTRAGVDGVWQKGCLVVPGGIVWYACPSPAPPTEPPHITSTSETEVDAAERYLDAAVLRVREPALALQGTLWGRLERRGRERWALRATALVKLVPAACIVALIAAILVGNWAESPDTYGPESWSAVIAVVMMTALVGSIVAWQARLPRAPSVRAFMSLGPRALRGDRRLDEAVERVRASVGMALDIRPCRIPTPGRNGCIADGGGGRLLLGITDGLLADVSVEELTAVIANLVAACFEDSGAGAVADAPALMLTKDPEPMLAVMERVLCGDHSVGLTSCRFEPAHDEAADRRRISDFRELISAEPRVRLVTAASPPRSFYDPE